MEQECDTTSPLGAGCPCFVRCNIARRQAEMERVLAALCNIFGTTDDVAKMSTSPLMLMLLQAFSGMVRTEGMRQLLPLLLDLKFYLCENQTDPQRLLFDVDGSTSRFTKAQVADVLAKVMVKVEVKREYFYLWIATHTNLADNASTAKTMLTRANRR